MANKYFRRKLRVTLTSKLKNTSLILASGEDVEKDLYVQGKIMKYPYTQMDALDLSIYNLNPITRGEIIASEYFNVKIEAGYLEGNFGTIYEGFVIRIIGGDVDATTNVTRFICTDSGEFRNFGFISASFNESANFFEIAEYVAANGTHPISIELDERLKNFKATGGRTVFGGQFDELQKIADDSGYELLVEGNKAKIFSFDQFSDTTETAVVLNADTGLIGVPTLTNSGIEFKALMNPNFKILGLVKINNSDIRNEQDEVIPNRDLGAYFSTDGLYKIIKLVYDFDNITGGFQVYGTALSRNVYESLSISG